jgi:hypothetical protein
MRSNSRWVSRAVIVGLMIGSLVLVGSGLGSAFDGEQASHPDLQDLPQSWDKKLPNASRFTVLTDFGGAAVRDNETGLVWEQSPETKTQNWSGARFQCTSRTIGGRKGWRLPSVHELGSLVDPSVIPMFTRPTIGRRRRLQESRPTRGTWALSWAWCTTSKRPIVTTCGVYAEAIMRMHIEKWGMKRVKRREPCRVVSEWG